MKTARQLRHELQAKEVEIARLRKAVSDIGVYMTGAREVQAATGWPIEKCNRLYAIIRACVNDETLEES